MWLNWYLCQWDLFIDSIPEMRENLFSFCKNTNKNLRTSYASDILSNKIIYFKKADEKSYIYYRQATQLIDGFLTDYNHIKYQTRHLIASVIFIIICIYYEIPYFTSSKEEMINLDENFFSQFFYGMPEFDFLVKNVFGEFLNQSFNINFEDILPACVYCSKFINYEFTYDLPLIIQLKNEQFENVIIF